jgi:hypothetical protein
MAAVQGVQSPRAYVGCDVTWPEQHMDLDRWPEPPESRLEVDLRAAIARIKELTATDRGVPRIARPVVAVCGDV